MAATSPPDVSSQSQPRPPAGEFCWPRRWPFLTASWRHLAMLNWEVPAEAVAPYVPPGLELDLHEGKTYASIVGFRFLSTRILGVPVPGHRDFDEVNLRLYVRRRLGTELRRGVVFVRELVPRRAIARVARALYNEPYSATVMSHDVELADESDQPPRRVEYAWRWQGEWCSAGLATLGDYCDAASGSLEQFIAEHYWGYTPQRNGSTREYQVAHPPWRLVAAGNVRFQASHAALVNLYGDQFAETLSRPPDSAFLAEGSAVRVYRNAVCGPE